MTIFINFLFLKTSGPNFTLTILVIYSWLEFKVGKHLLKMGMNVVFVSETDSKLRLNSAEKNYS